MKCNDLSHTCLPLIEYNNLEIKIRKIQNDFSEKYSHELDEMQQSRSDQDDDDGRNVKSEDKLKIIIK